MKCDVCKEREAEIIQPLIFAKEKVTIGIQLMMCTVCFDRYTFKIEDGKIKLIERGC